MVEMRRRVDNFRYGAQASRRDAPVSIDEVDRLSDRHDSTHHVTEAQYRAISDDHLMCVLSGRAKWYRMFSECAAGRIECLRLKQ
jgi:hypothetical protein